MARDHNNEELVMNRLIVAAIASVTLTAVAVAAPPSSRTTMPSPTIRVVTPPRPVTPVIVVPTTNTPRYWTPAPPTTIVPPRPTYAVYYRYDWMSPSSYYGTFSSLRRAHDVAFLLE